MLVIRLQRIGKKHEPHYRLVVAEKRSKLIAPPVEDLGSYNPSTKKTTLNKERIAYWIAKGAKPSVTAHNLLVKEGAVEAPKIKLVFKVEPKEAVAVEAAAPAEASEAPAEEPAPEASEEASA